MHIVSYLVVVIALMWVRQFSRDRDQGSIDEAEAEAEAGRGS